MASKIEWTEETWNPVTGCTKVSAGCKNCYAERMTKRLMTMPQSKKKYAAGFFKVVCHESELERPLRWKKPRTVFVNSMGDLFHPGVPREFLQGVWRTMGLCQHHTFQILTKRPERMSQLLRDTGVLPNVWLGTSVENQATADERIPHLLQCPAAVRFVSAEPLLGSINFRWAKWQPLGQEPGESTDHLDGLRRLDQIIVGGESGPGARPMHPAWARGIRDQCEAAGVPFFFKQWGDNCPAGGDNIKRTTTPYWLAQECRVPSRELWWEATLQNGETIKLDDNIKEKWIDPETIAVPMPKNRAGRLLDGIEHNGAPEGAGDEPNDKQA